MSLIRLLAGLLAAVTVACGGSAPAASSATATRPGTPTSTPVSTPSPSPLRDEVLLDVTGTGELPRSRTFISRGSTVNICWRLPGDGGGAFPELVVRLHDAATGEERAVVSSAGAASGCRAAPIRSVGQPHYLSVAIAAGAVWHIAVVGQ